MLKFFNRKEKLLRQENEDLSKELHSYKLALHDSEDEVMSLRKFVRSNIPDGDRLLIKFHQERGNIRPKRSSMEKETASIKGKPLSRKVRKSFENGRNI